MVIEKQAGVSQRGGERDKVLSFADGAPAGSSIRPLIH
jgi:hypothetical protein